MIKNYFTLYHLTLEMKSQLEDGYVFEIYSQQKNELTLNLITNNKQNVALVATANHSRLGIYFNADMSRRRRNTATLMDAINDKRIEALRISDCERIVYFDLEDGYRLALQVFSADTNFFLIKDGNVLEAFKGESLVGKAFEEAGTIPVLQNLERLSSDFGAFQEAWGKISGDDPVPRLIKIIPGFDRHLAKEVVARARKNHDEVNEFHFHEAVQQVFYELISPEPKIYFLDGQLVRFSIINETDLAYDHVLEYDSVNEALRAYSNRVHQEEHSGKEADDLKKRLQKLTEKTAQQLQTMGRENKEDRGKLYEQYGHLLIANLHRIAKGEAQVVVENVFEENRSETIKLEPAKSPYENAEAYFSRAKKAKQNLKILEKRLAELGALYEEQKHLLDGLSRVSRPKEFNVWKQSNLGQLRKFSLITKEAADQETLFKRFQISPSAELLVGKNAKSNDLLTFRHAKPNDIWLHARGVSGSHCVLKASQPCGNQEIERAAEIAAYYSSARGSEYVPVMYAPRKYVRKQKGGAPGAVTLEREEVVIVRPRLDVEEDE
ncbi:MAG: DUF814 domain-containing protein [Chlorobiales bacterium]|nr:DUF814 domain-containing protein [Chlorobiales bacterium]